MESKSFKRQKTKIKNQSSMGSLNNKAKKKSTKKITEDEELRNKIITYFSILNRQYVNKNELRWIFLNLNYSSYDTK